MSNYGSGGEAKKNNWQPLLIVAKKFFSKTKVRGNLTKRAKRW